MSPSAVLWAGGRLLARYIRNRPWSFTLALTGSLVFAGAVVASAMVVGRITDELIVPVLERGESPDRLVWAISAVVGVALAKAAGISLRRGAAAWLQYGTKNDLRKRLVDHQLGLSLRWFTRQPTGNLLSVAESDATQATYVLAPLPYGLGATVLLIASVVLIAATEIWLGLAALVWLLASLAVDFVGSWQMARLARRVQELRGRVSATAHESFDGALTVKALGRERYETERMRRDAEALRNELTAFGRVGATYNAALEILPGLASLALLVLGAWRIGAGSMSPGELVQVTFLLSLLLWPARLIGFVLWMLGESVASWQRVGSVLVADDHVSYGNQLARRIGHAAEVLGDRLGFAYPSGGPVLDGLTLSVPAGQTLAVVGPTGSGKTTLTLLLARLWDPDSGMVRLDGRDLRSFAPGALSTEVAYVAQDAFLFDDTIRGNISLGVEVDDSCVEWAARLAHAHDFIAALPEGYDTRVGERGITLSGGQRQRLALARALVRRPRLLVLDDATSAVDPSVETAILRDLAVADLPATVVIVAYRPSSIARADRVVYLDGGRIEAQGRHAELLDTVPAYARLLRAYEEDARRRTGQAGEART